MRSINKVVLIPDSFKGTMSSSEICGIMEKAIHRYHPACEVVSIPVADGGEGSVDCFLEALGGKKIRAEVKGPFFEEMESFYGLLPDGSAVVEMAACAGLPLVGERLAVESATTYGVGQLIRHAVEAGARKIVLGLGGSATNDGGCGMAAALGARFFAEDGGEFIPVGATLRDIARVDISAVSSLLAGVELVVMCDIDNPLCGENGAAHIFGPQKGADPEMVRFLDQGLRHMADVINSSLGMDIRDLPGAGAAGGMGAGAVAYLGGTLQMGIEAVLDTVDFDRVVRGADLVFSGEGKLDSQSLRGKVVVGVARRAKQAGVPLVAVVGDIADHIEPVYELGVSGVFSINRIAAPFSELKARSKQDLALTMDNLIRFLHTI